MDLLQSFCKTGHVIFCNVFLHTVCKTRDMLQLSQPLCLTQLLAAILSPCKHLKMSSIPVFCIFWRHSALLLTPPFLGLKAPDMIQRFPFLVHTSAHCLAVFAWYTRFLRGTNFRQDKDNLGGQQTFYKRKYVSLTQNWIAWIHFPISHAAYYLMNILMFRMDKNMEHFELQAALQDCECAQRCILIGSHLIRSDRSFPFPNCSCRSSDGFCISILIFRRCMRLVIWLVIASLNLDRLAILLSLAYCSSTDNLQSRLST